MKIHLFLLAYYRYRQFSQDNGLKWEKWEERASAVSKEGETVLPFNNT